MLSSHSWSIWRCRRERVFVGSAEALFWGSAVETGKAVLLLANLYQVVAADDRAAMRDLVTAFVAIIRSCRWWCRLCGAAGGRSSVWKRRTLNRLKKDLTKLKIKKYTCAAKHEHDSTIARQRKRP